MNAKKRLILETALRLFSENGYKETSIQKVAEACDISKGAVYLHFASKSDLLLAIAIFLDQEVKQAVRNIKDHPDLAPKEKLRQQIKYQFEEVIRNQAINEMILKEAGMQLDEETLLLVQQFRQGWLDLQIDFLRVVYGEQAKPHLIDLSVIFNGLLQEVYSFLFVERLELGSEEVTVFIANRMDDVVHGMISRKEMPLISKDLLPSHSELEMRIQNLAKAKAEKALAKMAIAAKKLPLDEEARAEIETSLQLMQTEIKKDAMNRVLLQGLLANVREYRELQDTRKIIARELKLKLL